MEAISCASAHSWSLKWYRTFLGVKILYLEEVQCPTSKASKDALVGFAVPTL